MGREVKDFEISQVLFLIFSDGSVEKQFIN